MMTLTRARLRCALALALAALLFSLSAAASTERIQRDAVAYEMSLKARPFVPAEVPVVPTGSTVYSNTTVGGPTFQRAFEDCSGLSTIGNGVSYHERPFTVDAAGNYAISSVQNGGWDGFLLLYQGTFNPANALTNCIAGDDDGAGGIGTSDITSIALTTGTTYILVTTGFSPADSGTFTNTLSGPGNVVLGGPPSADLGITKTTPGGVVVGGPTTYQLDAVNNGPIAATAVVVTDTLPAGVTFVGSTCGATATGNTVTWNIGNMANGATASCTLTVTLVGACSAVSNTATIDGAEADSVASNNSSTSSNGGGNVIADPSFEDGTPNGFWNEASTNFGTPICDTGTCGFGGGTGPRTGTFWSWFGGFGGGTETGSVDQSVTIPAGATSITFFTEFPVCEQVNGASDFVRLTIDGTEVWRADATSARCDTLGYQQETVALGAFADGAAHVVRFESTTVGGAPTNFFVDDIEINAAPTCTAPPATDLAISQTNTAGTNPVVGTEFTKTITVTNNGPAAANSFTVQDILPAQLQFVSSDCGATAAGQTVTWNGGAIPFPGSVSCTLTLRVIASGQFTNTATITASDPADNVPGNNTSTSGVITGTSPSFVANVPTLGVKALLALAALLGLFAMVAVRRRTT